eukprot:403337778
MYDPLSSSNSMRRFTPLRIKGHKPLATSSLYDDPNHLQSTAGSLTSTMRHPPSHLLGRMAEDELRMSNQRHQNSQHIRDSQNYADDQQRRRQSEVPRQGVRSYSRDSPPHDYHALRDKSGSPSRTMSHRQIIPARDPKELFREQYEKDLELERLRQEKELRDRKHKEELERLRNNTEFKLKKPSTLDEDLEKMKMLKMLQDDQKNVDNLAQSLRNYLEYQNMKDKQNQARIAALQDAANRKPPTSGKKKKSKRKRTISPVNDDAGYTKWTEGFSRKTILYDDQTDVLHDPLNVSKLLDGPTKSASVTRAMSNKSIRLNTPNAPILHLENKISSIMNPNKQNNLGLSKFISTASQGNQKGIMKENSLIITQEPKSSPGKQSPFLSRIKSGASIQAGKGLVLDNNIKVKKKVTINSKQMDSILGTYKPQLWKPQSAKIQSGSGRIQKSASKRIQRTPSQRSSKKGDSMIFVENLDDSLKLSQFPSENKQVHPMFLENLADPLVSDERINELINIVIQDKKKLQNEIQKSTQAPKPDLEKKLEVQYNQNEMQLKKFLELCTQHYKKCDNFVEELK